MDRHWGEVVDYDRDADGVVIPNGVLRINAPSLTGRYAVRVYPLPSGDVHKIPAVGATVAVYRLPGNAYCWTNQQRSSELPSWITDADKYPDVAGFDDSTGAIQIAVDNLKAMIGSIDATDPLVLMSKLTPILTGLADAILEHVHPVVGGPIDAAAGVKATTAKTAANNGDHGAEKAVGM